MLAGIAAFLLVLLGQAAELADVLVLKDGTKRTGRIIEENEEAVVLRITIKGSKGDVTGQLRIAREEIAEIRKAAAEPDAPDRQARQARIAVTSVTRDGCLWLLASGDLFEVQTTCAEEFARDLCDALEQAYATFLRRFPARRPANGRQRVVLLAGRAEYDEYLKRVHGTTVPDPATYLGDVLLACDCVHKDEATRMRGLLRQWRAEVDELRKKISEADERNRKMIEGANKEVSDNIAEERKRLHREGRATPEALRELEGRKQMALGLAEQLGKVMTAEVAEERKKAEAAIREREKAIRHDELLLRSQNRTMFERLFHEGFHAFASSRLSGVPRWLDEGMASYFEASTVESGNWVHGAPNAEMLKLYREKGALPPLGSVLRADGKLLSNRHEGRLERSDRAYAVSWALAHYLSARMTTEQWDAYLTAVAGGADAADALAKALGQPLGKIDEAVRAHVAALK